MITALTPDELILERIAAFTRKDFRSIFYSYHPDAPFRHFFPDSDTYLAYADTDIVDNFQIISCQILRSFQLGETVEVLYSQRLIHKGEVTDSIEIARCRCDDGIWLFLAGLRLDALKLPEDLLHCPWNELLSAGNDLWI